MRIWMPIKLNKIVVSRVVVTDNDTDCCLH